MKHWGCSLKSLVLFFILLFPLFVLGEESCSKGFQKSQAKETLVSQKDFWLGKDKAKHFLASFLMAGAASWVCNHRYNYGEKESIRLGMTFSFSLGIAKEWRDRYSSSGMFSWKDLTVDLLGVCFGALLLGGW